MWVQKQLKGGKKMVKIRPSTVMAGLSGKARPMNAIGAKGMQIVGSGAMTWSGKGSFLRNLPHTIENPHQGQIEQRIAFGEAASRAKGMKGLDPATGLPHAAAITQSELRGRKASHRMSPNAYPSKAKSSYHSIEQLRSMSGRGTVRRSSSRKSRRRL